MVLPVIARSSVSVCPISHPAHTPRNYGGEKFGNGIYYRLVYSAEYGKKWETVLVFEEKLLMSTIGQIMGSKTDQLNTVLVNASRYAAKQFVNCINERFPSEKPYEIKEENLLTVCLPSQIGIS